MPNQPTLSVRKAPLAAIPAMHAAALGCFVISLPGWLALALDAAGIW